MRLLDLVGLVPQVIVTAAAWPLAVWLKDYRVIVWLMVTKSVTGAVLSFMFARRPYRWRWDREHARSMLVFGWPLLLNGLVMFGCQQADYNYLKEKKEFFWRIQKFSRT